MTATSRNGKSPDWLQPIGKRKRQEIARQVTADVGALKRQKKP
jgi:hypothetical protein